MTSILETLQATLTPEVAESIGQALGLDRTTVLPGMQAAAPLVQSGLARLASSPEGVEQLMQSMPEVMETVGKGDVSPLLSSLGHTGGNLDMMASLMGKLTGASVGSRASMNEMVHGLLGGIFGDGLGAAGGTLDRALGIKVSPLLAAAAPLLMGVVGNVAQARKLDAAGIADLLQQESTRFLAAGGEEAQLVQAALHAGDEAIALKRKYAPEEWTNVRMAPLAAGAIVMAAAPSSAIGASQEIEAMVDGIETGKVHALPTALVSVAFDGAITDEELKLVTGKRPMEALVATITGALTAIAANDADALAGYKELIAHVASQVAEAAKEGGFFGIGGKQVSEAERDALREIQTLLG